MPLGMEVGLRPGHIVLDGDPAPPKGAQPPNFRPVSVVVKRSPISVTAEHLLWDTERCKYAFSVINESSTDNNGALNCQPNYPNYIRSATWPLQILFYSGVAVLRLQQVIQM